MCQHAKGESDWLVYREKQERLREIEICGGNDFVIGVLFSEHPHIKRLDTKAKPGRMYSDEWLHEHYYYKDEIASWEMGWKKACKEFEDGQ